MCNNGHGNTHLVLLLIEHERHDSPSGIGAVTGLAMNSNSGTAPAILVLSTGDSASGHWHDEVVDGKWK